MAYVFAGVTRAGAASVAPTKAKANTKANANADPSPLKGVRDDMEGGFLAGIFWSGYFLQTVRTF
jgi:hypothetical protein